MAEVKPERTNWRCEKISNRHRLYGLKTPAVDIDFLLLEHTYGIPAALVEYKDKHAREPNLDDSNYRAIKALADGYIRKLPFMIVFYCSDKWTYRVIPVNDTAKDSYAENQLMSEQEYVKSLYLLRNYVLEVGDELTISKLNNEIPENINLK